MSINSGFRLALVVLVLTLTCWLPRAAPGLELKAGTAKAVITPEPGRPRVLVMGGESKGWLRDLHARALSLNDGSHRMVIVTYDLNCLDVATPILRSRCRHELGLDPAYLVLMGTHNHAAPIQIVPDNYDYGRWLAERILALIQEAIANEAGPARLRFGTGRVNFIWAMGGHPVDPEVQALEVSRGDQVIAVLFNHASHPMQESFTRIETGHPGWAMDEIERRLPGALAMYADACGGNQFAKRGIVMLAPRAVVKSLGRDLADAVLQIMDGPMMDVTGPISSRLEIISLPLGPPLSRAEAEKLIKRKQIPTDIGFVPYPNPDRPTNWVRSLLMHYDQGLPFPTRTTDRVCTDDGFLVQELPEPREFPCVYEETIAATIGPLIFTAMQGEVCAPIGVRIKDAFRPGRPIMVFAYMGEHNLYIPTREIIHKDLYQANVIQTQYASPVPWDESVEDVMVESVIKLIKAMIE